MSTLRIVLVALLVFSNAAQAQRSASLYDIELMLIWVGTLKGEAGRVRADDRISAIKSYQRKLGVSPTGELTTGEFDRLRAESARNVSEFGFTQHLDKRSGVSLGFPTKAIEPNSGEAAKRGTDWMAADKSLRIATLKIPKSEASLSQFYSNMRSLPNRVFTFPVKNAETLGSDEDRFTLEGVYASRRFHFHMRSGASELRGFQISYPEEEASKWERVAYALMSTFEAFPQSLATPVAAFHAVNDMDARLQLQEFSKSRLREERDNIARGRVKTERRLALVIGNGSYSSNGVLVNPANDARDIAETLERVGFSVILSVDAPKRSIEQAIKRFSDEMKNVDVALFFYSGHGVQVGGRNYLLPVDAKIEKENDLRFDAISLDFVMQPMEEMAPISLIFLDACRDNPFSGVLAREVAKSINARPVLVERGLAPVLPTSGSGTYIAFATAPGKVALDGRGRNSPFTAALKQYLASPGLSLLEMMTAVTRDVIASTEGRQRPWVQYSLDGNFYFRTASAN